MKQVKVRFTEMSAGKNDTWWNSLDKKQQKEYIKQHPKSKYAKQAGAPKADSTNVGIQFKGKNDIGFTPAKPKKEKVKPSASEKETRKPTQRRVKIADPDAQIGFKGKNDIGFTPAKPKKEKVQKKTVNAILDKIKAYKYAITRIKEETKGTRNGAAIKRINAYRAKIASLREKLAKQKEAKKASPDAQVGFKSRFGIGFTPSKSKKETSAVKFKNKFGIGFEAFGGKTYSIIDRKGLVQFGPYESIEEAKDKFLEILRRAKGDQIVGWKIKAQKPM